MTPQRRSHLIILALVPVVVFAAVRCADSTAPLSTGQRSASAPSAATMAKIAQLREATDWIGKYHNDALRYVFTSISRIPLKARDKHSVCETARRAYGEFHHSRHGTPVPASVDAQLEGFCSAGGAASGRAAVLNSPKPFRTTEVSADAQALMDQVALAIDASTSFADLSDRVSAIEFTAASTLSYEEAEGVFTVGSIALSSANYWANNLTAWVPFTSTSEYSVLLATRIGTAGVDASPAFSGGDASGFSWGEWAQRVWTDTKAAAKRAAEGDVRAGGKAFIGTTIAGGPIVWDIIAGVAAAGSIGAVLQL